MAEIVVEVTFHLMTLRPLEDVPEEELTDLGRMVYMRALEKRNADA